MIWCLDAFEVAVQPIFETGRKAAAPICISKRNTFNQITRFVEKSNERMIFLKKVSLKLKDWARVICRIVEARIAVRVLIRFGGALIRLFFWGLGRFGLGNFRFGIRMWFRLRGWLRKVMLLDSGLKILKGFRLSHVHWPFTFAWTKVSCCHSGKANVLFADGHVVLETPR